MFEFECESFLGQGEVYTLSINLKKLQNTVQVSFEFFLIIKMLKLQTSTLGISYSYLLVIFLHTFHHGHALGFTDLLFVAYH